MTHESTAARPQAFGLRTIPPQAQLEQIPRELSFRPADPLAARTLSPRSVEGFNRDGFLTPFSLFEGAELRDLRGYFDQLTADLMASGENGSYVPSAHLFHGVVCELLTRLEIVDVIRDLLGEDIVGWDAHYFVKSAGDGRTIGWHRDADQWPLTPARTVSVWIALADTDLDNGGLCFVPGSHLDDSPPPARRPSDPCTKTARAARLQAGQASLHSDLLLHGSGPNLTSRSRPSLTLRYCTAQVRAHLGWNRGGVLVAGRDPSGHWSGPSRARSRRSRGEIRGRDALSARATNSEDDTLGG